MRKHAILLALILMTPGCFGDEEEDIRFNGEIPDDGVADLKFVLEDAEGPLWSLAEQEGKVVIMAFIFTRCDSCLASETTNPDLSLLPKLAGQSSAQQLALAAFFEY